MIAAFGCTQPELDANGKYCEIKSLKFVLLEPFILWWWWMHLLSGLYMVMDPQSQCVQNIKFWLFAVRPSVCVMRVSIFPKHTHKSMNYLDAYFSIEGIINSACASAAFYGCEFYSLFTLRCCPPAAAGREATKIIFHFYLRRFANRLALFFAQATILIKIYRVYWTCHKYLPECGEQSKRTLTWCARACFIFMVVLLS